MYFDWNVNVIFDLSDSIAMNVTDIEAAIASGVPHEKRTLNAHLVRSLQVTYERIFNFRNGDR